MPWRTIEGEELAPPSLPQLQVVIEGMLDKRRLLDFIRYFVVFEDEGGGVLVKKIAGYHQFHAVNRAVAEYDLGFLGRRRPARGRGVAHAGQRQEPDDGVSMPDGWCSNRGCKIPPSS